MLKQEEIKHVYTLLSIHRRNLALLLSQAALYDIRDVPLNVTNGIRDNRENIARLKQQLRDQGEVIYDQPTDVAPPVEPEPEVEVETTADHIKPGNIIYIAGSTSVLTLRFIVQMVRPDGTLVGKLRGFNKMFDVKETTYVNPAQLDRTRVGVLFGKLVAMVTDVTPYT